MSYEEVITRTKRIESFLEGIGAEGRGLHHKASSLKRSLDPDLVKKIRFVATIRNRLLHEDGFEVGTRLMKAFQKACDKIETGLEMVEPPGEQDEARIAPEESLMDMYVQRARDMDGCRMVDDTENKPERESPSVSHYIVRGIYAAFTALRQH